MMHGAVWFCTLDLPPGSLGSRTSAALAIVVDQNAGMHSLHEVGCKQVIALTSKKETICKWQGKTCYAAREQEAKLLLG